MPTLNWIGKEAVENHHLQIPYKLLKCDDTLSVGDKESGNLIVQGDNLEALKALLPYYAGQVNCIYIDPPYNTGNEEWSYNDNVNALEIKEWINKVVGKEGEDLSRHDKWLCMMYPRLQLLRRFLSKDGVIFINIDENEALNLGQICDEIFGNNRIGIFIWASRSGKGGTVKNLAAQHEYIFAYAKNKKEVELKPDIRTSKGGSYSDEKGFYKREQLRQWGQGDNREDRPSMFFPIITYDGKKVLPIKPDGSEGRWRFGIKSVQKMLQNKDLEFDEENGVINVFRKIRHGKITESAQGTLLLGLGSASTGTKELLEIFGYKAFPTVKPTMLINYILELVTYNKPKSLILDSFAGSGTTAHSILLLNKKEGNRKFILIEMEEQICKDVTRERVKKVIDGYEFTKKIGIKEKVEGLGGGFKYCILGEPLFDENGNIKSEVIFNELAYHIFFTETGVPLDTIFKKKEKSALIGIYKETAYYLLYNGIMGDKSLKGGNILTSNILNKLPKYKGKKIIYGEGCRLGSSKLRRENIIFKQVPYEIKVN